MANFNDMVRVRNGETGAIGYIARPLFENPRINRNGILVEVDEFAKPYVPELYKSKIEAPEDSVDAEEEEAD
jgi:hypothetical protein